MDHYQSHKVVEAAKIVKIEQSPADEVAPIGSDGTWRVYWEDAAGKTGDYKTVTHRWFEHHQPSVGGYLVKYSDDYVSYSPTDAFENGYKLVEKAKSARGQTSSFQHLDDAADQTVQTKGMTFGVVLDLLHGGHKARRPFWAEGTYIYLVEGSKFTVNRPPLNRIHAEGTEVQYSPHIDTHHFNAEDGTHHCMVYAMPQADVLATDWQVTA